MEMICQNRASRTIVIHYCPYASESPFIAIFFASIFPTQPYVAGLPTSHKLPMTLLAGISIIPYRPLRSTLARIRLQSLKVKPIAAPIALAMRSKMHRFVALQLKQVNTSVVTEDVIVFRDQIDHYSLYFRDHPTASPLAQQSPCRPYQR